MPISKVEAQRITTEFCRDYPGALALIFYFRENTAALYGAQADRVPTYMKGGYVSRKTEHAGRIYDGRVDVPLENVENKQDLLETLRHEVLGHYGANTFSPAEKRALLDGLAAARNEPTLKPLWDIVNARYEDESLDVRAEEVLALHCQGITPARHVEDLDLAQRGARAFAETCVARVRSMGAEDLDTIGCFVAQGLHDRSRRQQNFPHFNEVFRLEGTALTADAREEGEGTRKAAADPRAVAEAQRVLNAPIVTVYTTGREELSTRKSLQFVADQARLNQRPGFALEEPEKYVLPGGLDQRELDDLFRVTAGLQGEQTLRECVRAWALEGRTPPAGRVSPVLEKIMSTPVSVESLQRISEALRLGMARAFGESNAVQQSVNSGIRRS